MELVRYNNGLKIYRVVKKFDDTVIIEDMERNRRYHAKQKNLVVVRSTFFDQLIFNDPATILIVGDRKAVVKVDKHDVYDPKIGGLLAYIKYQLGDKLYREFKKEFFKAIPIVEKSEPIVENSTPVVKKSRKHKHHKGTKVSLRDRQTGMIYNFLSRVEASRFMGYSDNYLNNAIFSGVDYNKKWDWSRGNT